MSRVKSRTTLHPAERVRLRAGMTVEDASKQAGVNRKTIWNMEAGRAEPRPPALLALARVYNVDAADLLQEIRTFRAECDAAEEAAA